MEILINNEITNIPTEKNLSGLLLEMNLRDKKGIAIAINNEVIPKINWDSQLLKPNDKVMIITATQGG